MAEVSFGEWLKRQRKAAGLTQEQLAEQVSCSTITLRKIEAEERRPSAQIAERLAEIFSIPQDERTSFLRYARGELRYAREASGPEAPWQISAKSPRSNVPATTTSLIGRQKEIEEVHNYLLQADIRLVTLLGPPGIGKTRLSIEAARQSFADFPDGLFFIALAPLEHPNLILPTIFQTLGFVETKGQSLLEQLKEGIGEKQMLLVLDNCEHLIEEVASLVAELLATCPRLKILTTSREALRVSGEWLYSVPALDVPPLDLPEEITSLDLGSQFSALTLFAARARAVRSDFSLNAENLPAVASICARLDGLPLAIELIAARVRLMSPQALLERLHDQFVLSAEGMRTASARQKTLNDAIGWSYNLLSEEEQRCFAYLSIFSGGFTLEASEAMLSSRVAQKSVPDLIALLLDKSLLQRVPGEGGEPRFSMLVTIQEFARERLRDIGEEEIRNLHLAYFLHLAEQADREVHGPDQVAWMDRLELDLDNFRAALNWGLSSRQIENLLRLLAALSWTWMVRWASSEYRAWVEKIRALPESAESPASYARIVDIAVHNEWIAGNFREARAMAEESRALWQQLGPAGIQGLAEAFYLSGMIPLQEGDYNEAAPFFEQSFELYQKCDDKWGMAFARFFLGNVASEKDEYDKAVVWLKQSLDLFRDLSDPWGMARSSQRLGELFLKQGNHEEAQRYFEQHLKLDEELRFKQGLTVALTNLGTLYRHQGDYDQAEQYFEKGLAVGREYGLKHEGAFIFYNLGMNDLHQNSYLAARSHFRDYFDIARKMYEKISACDLLVSFAAVTAGMGKPERAARLYGAAQALFEATDYRIPPFDQAEFDRHIQVARGQLGGTRFEEVMSEGYEMTMEQAIVYALENSNE